MTSSSVKEDCASSALKHSYNCRVILFQWQWRATCPMNFQVTSYHRLQDSLSPQGEVDGEDESLNKWWHLTLGSEPEMPGLRSCAKGIKLAREGACDQWTVNWEQEQSLELVFIKFLELEPKYVLVTRRCCGSTDTYWETWWMWEFMIMTNYGNITAFPMTL